MFTSFPILRSLIPLSPKQINFMVQALSFQAKLPSHRKPAQLNNVAKTSNLELNLSLISNKAPMFYSVICSESNNVSLISKQNTTVK